MLQSESINKLLAALTSAQAKFQTLPKDKAGYGYKYTDFDTVVSYVRPIMAEFKLGFMQSLTTTEAGKNALTTRIFNAEGEFIEDTVALPEITVGKTNAAQNMGAAITYMKRYALCAVLGISSDEDTDATTEQAPASKSAPAPKPQAPAKPAEAAKSQLKGGPDTKEEHEAINALLAAKKPDGSPVFEPTYAKQLGQLRKNLTAQEVIAEMRKTIGSYQKSDGTPAEAPAEEIPIY